MPNVEIRRCLNGDIIVSGEYESIKDCLEKNRDANLEDANLEDAYLRGANLVGANLTGANLIDANLIDANLEDANLEDANLTGANLIDANLIDANLEDANLEDAYLRGANLIDANLTGANLIDANLEDANLRGAYLIGIKNYSELHEIFYELVRKHQCKDFTDQQWSMIGKIVVHRLCWDTIKNRFGKDFMPILDILAKDGFDEYQKRYTELLEAADERA